MGGYRRVAAALELEYLNPKRGRGDSAPWSLDSSGSELALVQFRQQIPEARMHQSSSSSNSKGTEMHPEDVMASHRVQLQQLPDLLSMSRTKHGTYAARRRPRRTDHDREQWSEGKLRHQYAYSCP